MPGFTPDPKLLPLIKKLHLLDFTPFEMMESVEKLSTRPVLLSEIEQHIEYLYERWRDSPELEAVDEAEGLLWERSHMFRRDMLDLYSDQLQNARATMMGDFNHADGRPVIKTKPGEVITIAEKILSMEREVVESKRRALLRLVEATTGKTPEAPAPSPQRFVLTEPTDEDYGDFEPPERTDL